MLLESGQHVVVQRRLLGGLDLRQVEHDRRAVPAQPLVVVDHVEHQVGDRGGEAGAVGLPDVTVVEVQPAHAEDLGREVELLLPVVDDLAAEEALGPAVHLAGDLLGDFQEQRVAVDRQLEVALVVERHRLGLAQGVLAVEHPAVGARQQRVGHVADALFDRAPRLGARSGALDPLPFQVVRDLRPFEISVAGILHPDIRPRNRRLRVQKGDPLSVFESPAAALDTGRHQLAAVPVQRGQGRQGLECVFRINVWIVPLQGPTDLQVDGRGHTVSFLQVLRGREAARRCIVGISRGIRYVVQRTP